MVRQTKRTDRLSDIRYAQPYLSEVIVRLDFLNSIEEIKDKLPSQISKKIKKLFPIAEPQRIIASELQLNSGTEIKARDKTGMEWRFFGKDREKRLNLGRQAIAITYDTYTSYEDLKKDFHTTLDACFEVFPDLQGKRLGLRYVNEINVPGKNPFAWEGYLDDGLLGILEFVPDSGHVSRVFHILEYNYGDCNLRYQFGLPNSDFPAPIRERTFVMDFDAYYQGIYDRTDIGEALDKFHERIQNLFEKSITDQLRENMNTR